MEDIAKYILLGLLTLPFAALASDILGRSENLTIAVLIIVTAVSAVIMLLLGGLHQRPNVASIYGWAFVAWPFLLLIAKGVNAKISWGTMWASVPIMSWFTTNTMMQFWYPTNGGGGGLGLGVGLVFGWFHMVIPFALMNMIFIGLQRLIRMFRKHTESPLTPDS